MLVGMLLALIGVGTYSYVKQIGTQSNKGNLSAIHLEHDKVDQLTVFHQDMASTNHA